MGVRKGWSVCDRDGDIGGQYGGFVGFDFIITLAGNNLFCSEVGLKLLGVSRSAGRLWRPLPSTYNVPA